ncbi:phosphonate C-P lyase system protein PhnH [Aestuariivirga sp.]|uniref:phosphonate C-P lyase system protein PhnH n=1 Tax=Aestuariivirga sp. TaxID=2650926 RepID=UPI0035B107E9
MTERGFTDVAVQSAHAFRSIMQAMARPGRVMLLDADIEPPAPLLPSAAAVALTLCDFQTPVWLSPELDNERVVHYLRFHAGAPIVAEPQAAQFVFTTAVELLPQPGLLLQGTHEYPDRSATLVIQVAGFGATDVELSGPGIRGAEHFGVAGLDEVFWSAMAENHARFPVGIDVIFAAPAQLAALPRSTAIRMLESA